VRWGWIQAFGELNETEKAIIVRGPFDSIGLLADDASAEWLWDQKLAMVGGDNPAFESIPFNGHIGGGDGTTFHQLFLAGR
jgi:hypothetical protein